MMAGTLRVRRSRGALSGSLLVLLGVWGALIPFIGPYFNYAYTPDRAWTATSGRMWLDVLPGVVTLAGGLVVLLSRFRPAVLFGSWLAALAGAWFAVGALIAGHWAGLPAPGTPVGSAGRSALEQLGFFTGVGVAIVFVAALALGRFTVVAVADAAASSAGPAAAAKTGAAAGTEPAAARTRIGALPRASLVPVIRGRSRGADTADADATAATARAD
ncbi:MAG TPA: hypothetical protein VGH53_17600 [Streptosporangiaceae bacterium]|jgi:hypothetical protein